MKERREKRARRLLISKRIATFIFLYIILFVFFLTYNITMKTFSKYASADSKDAEASIAKWEVSLDTENSNNTFNTISGDTVQYILKIISESEIASCYTVVLSDLPSEIQVSIDGGIFQTPTNNMITYTNLGEFDLDDEETEHTHTLAFLIPLDSNIIDINEINIDVQVSQKVI